MPHDAHAAPRLSDASLLRDRAFVDGAWIEARSGERFAVANPASGAVIANVSDLGAAEAALAVEAAASAQPAWAAQTARARATLLRRWHDQIIGNLEDLARLLTTEQGKPLSEARAEIAFGASFVEWFAEEAKRLYGDVVPSHQSDRRVLVLKQPVGVAAAVTPWNFPLAMITRKCGPALAAGCTFVVKPARETPLTALALAELSVRAGIPPGVFNVITSSRASEIGHELTTNPAVRKFSFTGSTAVGRQLMGQCASTVKRVSLELGGNAPFIVFEDADIAAAARGALVAKFRNSGQTCVCANRFLVQDRVYAAFEAALLQHVAELRVGEGLAEGVTQGPLISRSAVDKLERLVGQAVAAGARLVTGGRRHARGGSFFEPTVLAEVTPDMAISREEIFGPVATLTRFAGEADAVRIANDTEYGLAAYFYTRDPARIWRVGEALEAGMVVANEGLLSTEVAPFGGVKQSGLGREGSRYGIEDYVEIKYLLMGGL